MRRFKEKFTKIFLEKSKALQQLLIKSNSNLIPKPITEDMQILYARNVRDKCEIHKD